MHNYIRIGGVNEDLPDDFGQRMATLMDQLERGIEECDELLSQNEMFSGANKGNRRHFGRGGDRSWSYRTRSQGVRRAGGRPNI